MSVTNNQELCRDIQSLFMMKRIVILVCISALTFSVYSQLPADTLQEKFSGIDDRLNSLDEKTTLHENDLGKLTKIKVSGYLQAQYEYYQGGLVKPNDPVNTFFVRRARIKFTYEATDGIRFVLQPDFSTGNLS